MYLAVRNSLSLLVLLSGVVTALTALVYLSPRDARVDFERGFEDGFVSSFHPRERTSTGYFRWTREVSYIDFHHLPRKGRLSVEARLGSVRARENASVVFSANGVSVHVAAVSPGTATYRFDLPSPGSHLRLGIEAEPFIASGRRLGVQARDVIVRFPPEAHASWQAPAAWMALAAASFFLVGCVAGTSALVSSVGAFTTSLVFLYLLGQHSVRFTSYPQEVFLLAVATLVFAGLVRFVLDRARWFRLRESDRPVAVAAIALCFVIEFAVASYPLTLSSDANFQSNRMADFLSGNWHPTSVTQHDPPFQIPYPVSLYAVASPLAGLGLTNVISLELVTGFFEVIVSTVLIFGVWRFLDNLAAGVLAGVSYQLVPMNALAFSAGNFTNIFAVSMLALAFVLLVEAWHGGGRAAIACGAATLFAITAHFGLLLEAVVLFPAWLLSLRFANGRGRWLSLSVAAAFLVAGVYYVGYWEILSGQWQRLLEGESSSGGLGAPVDKLQLSLSLIQEQLGWVFLGAAAFGGFDLLRERSGSPLAVASTVWLAVTVFFFVVDLLSAVGVRYLLQALPLFALLAGSGLAKGLASGRAPRAIAIASTLYLAAMGLLTLHDVLFVRYH